MGTRKILHGWNDVTGGPVHMHGGSERPAGT
jgi:hypothetical protein